MYNLSRRPAQLFDGEGVDINFTKTDVRWVHHPQSDALVVEVLLVYMMFTEC